MSQKPKKVEKNPDLHWFVYEFCGGLTKASFALQVSSATLYDWLTAGFVRTREKAIEAAEMCDGRVSAAALLALPWNFEGGPGKGRTARQGHATEIGTAPAAPPARVAQTGTQARGRTVVAKARKGRPSRQRRELRGIFLPNTPTDGLRQAVGF